MPRDFERPRSNRTTSDRRPSDGAGRGSSGSGRSAERGTSGRDTRPNDEAPDEWGNTTHQQRRVSGLRRRTPAGVEILDGSKRKRRTSEAESPAAADRKMTLKGTPKPRRASGSAQPAKAVSKRSPKSNATRSDLRNERPGRPANSSSTYPTRRKRTRPLTDPAAELLKLSPRRGPKLVAQMHQASDAVADGRDRDAVRLLRPLREEVPQAIAVRELLGVALYRTGNFREAKGELETFSEMTGSVEQHPVLMDIARSQGKAQRVAELWAELSSISPSAALVTEGRIVYAGMLADQGDLTGAIAFVERGATQKPARVRDHHLRRWYVLGDLYDRSGNAPRARSWFERIAKAQAGYVDVAERLSRL
jgi:predicted Zn-dependent protease